MPSHSYLEVGDQFTLNMSLSPLHINWARQQLKKDVINILRETTQSTVTIRRASPKKNLIIRR
jgi:hypothetical protein